MRRYEAEQTGSLWDLLRPQPRGTFTADEQAPKPQRIITAIEPPKPPNPYSVPLGVTLDGDAVRLKLFERHTLICGSSGSGKSYLANRILAQIVQIPPEMRYLVGIDLKLSEIAKWHGGGCLDAMAVNYEYAALILGNVKREMDRRNALILNSPEKYRESKIKPSPAFPLIVVYVDELATLAIPIKGGSKDDEEARKTAFNYLGELLFKSRSAGVCVICCIQRPDSSIIGGFNKNNFHQVLCGKVSSRIDSEVVLGAGSADYADASKLSNFWFYYQDDRNRIQTIKPPGEENDADLWRVIHDPATTVDKDRGKWLYDKSNGANQAKQAKKAREQKQQQKPAQEPAPAPKPEPPKPPQNEQKTEQKKAPETPSKNSNFENLTPCKNAEKSKIDDEFDAIFSKFFTG